jgi:hypothetical protein
MGDLALAERFRGCMVGALVGDCLGAHFECRHENLVPPSLLDNFFGELERQVNNIKRQVSFSCLQFFFFLGKRTLSVSVPDLYLLRKENPDPDLDPSF